MWLCGARQWRGQTGTSSEPARGTRGAPPPLYSHGGATLNACNIHHGMLLGQAGLAARDAWMAGAAVEAISSPPQVAQLRTTTPPFWYTMLQILLLHQRGITAVVLVTAKIAAGGGQMGRQAVSGPSCTSHHTGPPLPHNNPCWHPHAECTSVACV